MLSLLSPGPEIQRANVLPLSCILSTRICCLWLGSLLCKFSKGLVLPQQWPCQNQYTCPQFLEVQGLCNTKSYDLPQHLFS